MNANGKDTDLRSKTEVEWAKGIIPDFQDSKVQENVDNAKRNR